MASPPLITSENRKRMSRTETDREARLVELETRLAFQEQTLEELHQALYLQ